MITLICDTHIQDFFLIHLKRNPKYEALNLNEKEDIVDYLTELFRDGDYTVNLSLLQWLEYDINFDEILHKK